MEIKFGTKIPGVSTKKLFSYQLRSIRSKLRPLWKTFANRGVGSKDDQSSMTSELYETVKNLVSLFHDASSVATGKRNRDSETEFQKLLSVLKSEEDVCLDIMKCFGIYYSLESDSEKKSNLTLSTELQITLSLMIKELFNNASPSVTTSTPDLLEYENQEDEDLDLPSTNRAVNNDQYVSEVILTGCELLKATHENLKRSTIDNEKELKALITFTSSFIENTFQNVLVQFNNRKKLYLLVCNSFLHSALDIVSLANNTNGPYTDELNSLVRHINVSLEIGLLDSKHVDDLSTIYLPVSDDLSAALNASTTTTTAGGKSNKKAKGPNGSETSTTAVEGAAPPAPVKVVKYNPSFYETLFQRLVDYCYASEATDPLTWAHKADSISSLLSIYANRSLAKSVAAKHAEASSYNPKYKAVDDSLDSTAHRKHIHRVLHFTFLLIEFLKRKPSNPEDNNKNGSNKRKNDDLNENTSSELIGSHLIGYKTVRNRILKQLCRLLDGQVIPQHESLIVYQLRLQCLSREVHHNVLSRSTDENLFKNKDSLTLFNQIALDADCYRIIASFDQSCVTNEIAASIRLLFAEVTLIPLSSSADAPLVPTGGAAGASYSSWQSDLQKRCGVSANDVYAALVNKAENDLSGRKSLLVDQATVDPLSIDCIAKYEGSIDLFKHLLPDVLRSFGNGQLDLTDSDLEYYFAVLRLYHSKYLLLRLFLSIHCELRTITDFVQELVAQDCVSSQHQSHTLLDAVMTSSPIHNMWVKAFLIIPTGQVTLLWSALRGSVVDNNTESTKEAVSHFGVLSCSVLDAFLIALQQTVKSSAQVYSSAGVAVETTTEDALLQHMVHILFKLHLTMQPFGEDTSDNKNTDTVGRTMLSQSVLKSVSTLISYSTSYFSSAVNQLLLPITINENNKKSFFDVSVQSINATTKIMRTFNSSDQSKCLPQVLQVFLSLIQLQSNVDAKLLTKSKTTPTTTTATTATTATSASTTAVTPSKVNKLIEPVIKLLEAMGVQKDQPELSLKLLLLMLNNAHIWLQFTQDSHKDIIHSEVLTPLLVHYLRCSIDGIKSVQFSTVIRAINRKLTSVILVDSLFVQSTLLNAVNLLWSELLTKANSKEVNALVVILSDVLPHSTLTELVPRLYSHLLTLCADQASQQYDVINDVAALLIKHLRSAYHKIPEVTVEETNFAPFSHINAVCHMVSNSLIVSNATLTKTPSKQKGATKTNVSNNNIENYVKASLSLLTAVKNFKFTDVVPALDNVLLLVKLLLDSWIGHVFASESQTSNTLDLILTEISALMTSHNGTNNLIHNQIKRSVFHAVVSSLKGLSEDHQLVSESVRSMNKTVLTAFKSLIDKMLSTSATGKALKSGQFASDDNLHCVAECLTVINSLYPTSSATCGNEDEAAENAHQFTRKTISQVREILLLKHEQLSQSEESADGWLYLFGMLSTSFIISTQTITEKNLPDDERKLVEVDLSKVESFSAILEAETLHHIKHQAASFTTTAIVSPQVSMSVIKFIGALVRKVLGPIGNICDSDAVDVYSRVFNTLLKALLRELNTLSSTEHKSRSLLVQYIATISKEMFLYFCHTKDELNKDNNDNNRDKIEALLEKMIRNVRETFEWLITVQCIATSYEDSLELMNLLHHIHEITSFLHDSAHPSTSSGAKIVTVDRSHTANANKRLKIWSEGLVSLMSTFVSKLQSLPFTVVNDNNTRCVLSSYLGAVGVSKEILVCMERIVTHSSLSNLNTSLSVFVQLLCRLVVLLLTVDSALSLPGTTHQRAFSSYTTITQAIEGLVAQCYKLVAKTLSNIASSRDLEKEGHLVAAVVVDHLAKLNISKSVKDNLYPGLYALFEKCDLKLKNQMFRLLNVTSRAVMTDIHDEYVRSFKFVGK